MEEYICSTCKQTYTAASMVWRCTCGGMLDIHKDTPRIDQASWDPQVRTLWRYVQTMPFAKEHGTWKTVTLGEGQTPLVVLDTLDPFTYVKVDYMMPTLSFKDRGAAVLITKAKESGVSKVIADSSGNAGTAIAAYAARCAIACDVYVSAHTSPKKIAQIKAHHAAIKQVKGTREDVAAAAQQVVEAEGIFYASHVYNPWFFEGTKHMPMKSMRSSDVLPTR